MSTLKSEFFEMLCSSLWYQTPFRCHKVDKCGLRRYYDHILHSEDTSWIKLTNETHWVCLKPSWSPHCVLLSGKLMSVPTCCFAVLTVEEKRGGNVSHRVLGVWKIWPCCDQTLKLIAMTKLESRSSKVIKSWMRWGKGNTERSHLRKCICIAIRVEIPDIYWNVILYHDLVEPDIWLCLDWEQGLCHLEGKVWVQCFRCTQETKETLETYIY